MHTLVLLRHGESTWNLANRFSGWTDVDLTEAGRGQARTAGVLLREAGFEFDVAFTSVLKRAIRTLWIALDEMDRMWIPVHRDWRLNERHYGALQGLNKAETAARYGEDQVLRWRRSYDEPPPALEPGDERRPEADPRYSGVPDLPGTECLKDTVQRMMPLWDESIAPRVRAGERVLVLHAIAADVPVVLGEHMLEVHIVVAEAAFRVQHGRHHGQAAVVAIVEQQEARLAVHRHLAQALAQEAGVRHHVVAHLAVAGHAEVQQLIVLRVHARGGS